MQNESVYPPIGGIPGLRVTGIDLNAEWLALARSRDPLHVLAGRVLIGEEKTLFNIPGEVKL
jgi:hypothetical protein